MLRKLRIILAAFCFVAITLLFLDLSGALRTWFGWLAKIQLLPAVLALNVGVVAALAVVTLLFGRVYCSVICPLGVFQDCVSHVSASRKGKKARFEYSKEKKILRYGVLAVFVVLLVAGLNSIAALIAPYSAYGRMVQSILAPVYGWGNNLLAAISERAGSYAFVTKEVWLKSLPTLIVAIVTLVVIVWMSWTKGRSYCNSICPVGTTLSFLSRFAMFRPVIDQSKCKSCKACEKKCKASCIDIASKKIDYSRCVDCFNCLDNCKFGALKYRFAWKKAAPADSVASDAGSAVKASATAAAAPAAGSAAPASEGRRAFLMGSAAVIGGTALSGISLKAQDSSDENRKTDGGFADILPKKAPERSVPITPFGSESVEKFYQHCTACQLCVAACPNNVLRPSGSLEHLMQPEMSFERGYCRPECVKCSEVCPAGAILKITPEEKSDWKVGTASVNYDLCVPATEGLECGNCARHCPVGAISMVKKDPEDESREAVRIPAVNEERCIGCGACENLCPSRPLSAITVNGYSVHHKLS